MATIKEAKPNTNLTLDKVTVAEKGPVREFSRMGRLGRVCTAKIKDSTGTMDLSLWNDEIDVIEEGDTIRLTDGWCKEWSGNLQASTGKNGKIEKL
jgi:ssDNA-binding replication factor A large subunit